jgi:hypothetical protein
MSKQLPQEQFTTKGGTTLPLLNLKGKPYMQAQHRLVWFNEENKNFHIDTQIIEKSSEPGKEYAIAKAVITILNDQGQPVKKATDYKQESKKDFPDFIEKSLTGAVSRALLQLGYGTAFAGQELDEGMRLADSPMMPATFTKPTEVKTEAVTVAAPTTVAQNSSSNAEGGSFSGRRRRKVESLVEVQDDGI